MPQKLNDAKRMAMRRQERLTQLTPDVQRLLESGVSVTYHIDGELVRELPDGQRFVVRLIDGGRSEERVRDVLNAADQARIRSFVDSNAAVAKARAFGTDVSQTLRNALLSPEERWRRANSAIVQTRLLCGAAKRGRPKTTLKRG